jgi:hypothetical protein
MSEEHEKQFAEECAALLELAQEIAVKHNLKVGCTVFEDGKGWVNSGENEICKIGFRKPANKPVICK